MQQNPILSYVLFFVVKDILCTHNSLVSIHLRLLNRHTQLTLYGRQNIEQSCSVWLICDLTLWILTGVISHDYLLILDPYFLIHHYKESGVRLCFVWNKNPFLDLFCFTLWSISCALVILYFQFVFGLWTTVTNWPYPVANTLNEVVDCAWFLISLFESW